MLTDAPPRKANRAGFLQSDRIRALDLPQVGGWLATTKSIESAMKAGTSTDVRGACAAFLAVTSQFYRVPACGIRVLAARPLRVRESWSTELFGGYTPETMLIRVWMRTAMRKEITSFGTFLSTLCHEFCHHLDYQKSGFPIHGTPVGSTSEPLCSTTMRGGRRRSDYSGYLCEADAGESTGRGRIAVRDFGSNPYAEPTILTSMLISGLGWILRVRQRKTSPLRQRGARIAHSRGTP